MHQVPVVPHNDVVALLRERRPPGRGIGCIDVYLLTTVVERLKFCADPRLPTLAHSWDRLRLS